MNPNINLGKIDDNSFKESTAINIAKLILESNKKIKTHFLEMDKTPNFDGKAMILDGAFERITVEVQIKTLPNQIKQDSKGKFKFSCDTKAMNCVSKNVTLNPVVLFVVDTKEICLYYKFLTKEYIKTLNIGNKQTTTIYFSEVDKFDEHRFINEIYQHIKITESNFECLTECGKIRESVRNIANTTKKEFQFVYKRGKVKGYFTSYKYQYDNNTKFILLSEIKMNCENIEEKVLFQYDKDYININRQPVELSSITDADIANIILEIEKEIKKPIMYTNAGKPTYWFNNGLLWQLRAEEIDLDWYLRF